MVVRRLGREVDHSPSYSAEAKNEWSYTSTGPTYLRGLKRENFAFIILQLYGQNTFKSSDGVFR
jgi:hypothetical protein